MKKKIIEILEKNQHWDSGEDGQFQHDLVFAISYEKVADEIVKLLSIHDITQQRELLIAFLQYIDKIDLVEYEGMSHTDITEGFKRTPTAMIL